MVQRTRHLGPVHNHGSDYLYDRQFKRGTAGRRNQQRVKNKLTRRLRRAGQRAALDQIRDET